MYLTCTRHKKWCTPKLDPSYASVWLCNDVIPEVYSQHEVCQPAVIHTMTLYFNKLGYKFCSPCPACCEASVVPRELCVCNLKLNAGDSSAVERIHTNAKVLACDIQLSDMPGKCPRLYCFFLRPCASVCGTICHEWAKSIVLGVLCHGLA